MAKEKIGNLLKFTEYDHLQPKQTPTKKTEVGGFAVLESKEELIAKLVKKTGKKKKKFSNLTEEELKKKLKKLKKKAKTEKIEKFDDKAEDKAAKPEEKVEKPEEKTEKEEEKNESLLNEKKASAKQLAARKKFMEMIASKKGKKEDKGCGCKK